MRWGNSSFIPPKDKPISRSIPTWDSGPPNWMAKSFMMAGKNAGFDMTSEKGMQAFNAFYNANLPRFGGLSDNLLLPPLSDDWEPGFRPDELGSGRGKKAGLKAKYKRKLAKASRKKNRKRK